MRPQHHSFYRDADVVYQAAVLAEGLVAGHCFVDGNKRTAWTVLRAFLIVNGMGDLSCSVDAAVVRMVRLTTREESADDLARWLRGHLRHDLA